MQKTKKSRTSKIESRKLKNLYPGQVSEPLCPECGFSRVSEHGMVCSSCEWAISAEKDYYRGRD
jgi:predicted RNA-binding Zn-ribbon protein involved in translation (DUF1610 family)